MGIGIGGLEGRMDDVKPLCCKDRIKGGGKLAVIVMDQEANSGGLGFQFPNQLAGLLGDPALIGMSCDPGEMNPAGAQFNKEEHVKSLEPDGFHCEEVTC